MSSGFKTKKSLGQNFLQDDFTIESIADASGAGPEDTVVEIGPGLGVLTDALAERAGKVIAVELDDRLIPILRTKFALSDNVEIVHEDILKFDWSSVCDVEKETDEARREPYSGEIPSASSGKLYIVGNLPYYITTPILLGILEKKVPAEKITVMVQKEVADRIVAGPGGKDYGVLSISLQYYGKTEKVLDVPREFFKPVPNVDSAVVTLELKKERPLSGQMEEKFFRLVKQAFSQRRKTLLNSLNGFDGLGKQDIENRLNNLNIDPNRRAETLSVEDYIKLCKEI